VPRGLTDEERALWDRVARATRRLRPAPDPEPAPPETALQPDPGAPAPDNRAPAARPPLPPITPRGPDWPALAVDPAPHPARHWADAPPRLDAGLARRLKRGKLPPEARLDLHGMTRAQARAALTGFVVSAQGRGLRLVLVITGKGRERPDDRLAVPDRPGALRHEMPHWLAAPPLRALVQDLQPAHRSHGGGGAWYLWLRRRG